MSGFKVLKEGLQSPPLVAKKKKKKNGLNTGGANSVHK